jgi:uncharacterized membrane protein
MLASTRPSAQADIRMPPPRARWFRALVLAVVAGCGTNDGPGGQTTTCEPGLPTTDACATNAPSYATVIAPLVRERCLSCHFAGNRNSSVVLETQQELSQRTQLVETQVYRCTMPPPGDAPPLAEAERAELLQWLVCGAPNN